MKIHTKTNHLIRPCLAMSFALAIGLPVQLQSLAIWSPVQLQSAEPVEGHEMRMEKCEEMKKEKQEMQTKVKAQDAELTAVVATMNSAAQDKKLDLVADIVTRLVEQRTAIQFQKTNLQEKMMKHLMGHMELGKESMAKCPMIKSMKEMNDMKGMKGMDGKSADAHKGHQQK